MTVFAKFLIDNDIIPLTIADQVGGIEQNLTKENFNTSVREIAQMVYWHLSPEEIEHVLTGDKFFRTPPLNNPEFYKKGGYAFRQVFSRYASTFRGQSDEIVVMEDYFDTQTYEYLKEIIESFQISENKQEFNVYTNHTNNITLMTAAALLLDESLNYMGYAPNTPCYQSGTDSFYNTSFVQRIPNHPQDTDIQKVCHSDAFFPCMKYWWFIDDVDETQGCFHYTKGSTTLTPDLLKWNYQQSLDVVNGTWDRARNKGHGEGSFRIFEDELNMLGFELTPMKVKANTLVMADTSGFHCRGNTVEPFVRSAMHGQVRVQNCYDI